MDLASVEVDPAYRSVFDAMNLNTCQAVEDYFVRSGDKAEYGVLLKCQALECPGSKPLTVYFKQYEQSPGSWRYLLRHSKARCEYINYHRMADIGLRVASRVAWGEQRDRLGRLLKAFIITVAVPNSRTLVEYFNESWPTRAFVETRRRRISLMRELGATVRDMHDHQYFHHDLVWRNLLVTERENGQPKVWWIDCPRGGYDRGSPRRRHKLLRDLGSFDKSAGRRQCTFAERLAFFLAYQRRSRLDKDTKILIKDVTAYSRRRWSDRR